jgi:hypothetical protein
MPYMTRPNTEIQTWYGVRLVRAGELVLVDPNDVAALVAEGWSLGTDPDTTNTTPIASDED